MAPPRSSPRLFDLDPPVVGIQAARAVLDHMQQQATRLGPLAVRLPTPTDDELASTDLALTVADLTLWAKGGHGDPDDVQDQVSDVAAALYSAAGGGHVPIDVMGDADPETAIGLVIVAAVARLRILEGDPVSAIQLATLASLVPEGVRRLIRTGEIKSGHDGVSAAEARRWLSARGVPGFDGKRKR